MSNFNSKIIKWEDSEFLSLNCINNSAKQDLFGFIIGYAKEKKILDFLDLGCGKGGQWIWYYSNNICPIAFKKTFIKSFLFINSI